VGGTGMSGGINERNEGGKRKLGIERNEQKSRRKNEADYGPMGYW
jgi:hypothetical protein